MLQSGDHRIQNTVLQQEEHIIKNKALQPREYRIQNTALQPGNTEHRIQNTVLQPGEHKILKLVIRIKWKYIYCLSVFYILYISLYILI